MSAGGQLAGTAFSARYGVRVSSEPFVSYGQNGEDVVLFRALGHLGEGRYVEVGANDPTVDSISHAFYERGWSGITVEPVHVYAERHRAERPRDIVVEAAISPDPSGSVVLHQIPDTGLSTLVDDIGEMHREGGWAVVNETVPARRLGDVLADAGWQDSDIHFMVVDTEGSERTVLETIDLHRWRPWVLVIEATEPQSKTQSHQAWESLVLDADYRFCLFDGLSRFYVSAEKYDELHESLSYPACVHDNYVTRYVVELRSELAGAKAAAEKAQEDVDRANAEVTRVSEDMDQQQEAMAQERELLQQDAADARAAQDAAVASVLRWREKAVVAWAGSSVGSQADMSELLFLREHAHSLFTELGAMRKTLSWRVTAPLRQVRRVVPRRPGA